MTKTETLQEKKLHKQALSTKMAHLNDSMAKLRKELLEEECEWADTAHEYSEVCKELADER